MTDIVCTIHRDTTISEVEGIFVSRNISGAPLVDDRQIVVGFISKSDINRFDFTDGDHSYTTAWEIASPHILTVSSDVPVQKAAELMHEAFVHHLIVVDDNVMVGILSSMDIVKFVAEMDFS